MERQRRNAAVSTLITGAETLHGILAVSYGLREADLLRPSRHAHFVRKIAGRSY